MVGRQREGLEYLEEFRGVKVCFRVDLFKILWVIVIEQGFLSSKNDVRNGHTVLRIVTYTV